MPCSREYSNRAVPSKKPIPLPCAVGETAILASSCRPVSGWYTNAQHPTTFPSSSARNISPPLRIISPSGSPNIFKSDSSRQKNFSIHSRFKCMKSSRYLLSQRVIFTGGVNFICCHKMFFVLGCYSTRCLMATKLQQTNKLPNIHGDK